MDVGSREFFECDSVPIVLASSKHSSVVIKVVLLICCLDGGDVCPGELIALDLLQGLFSPRPLPLPAHWFFCLVGLVSVDTPHPKPFPKVIPSVNETPSVFRSCFSSFGFGTTFW